MLSNRQFVKIFPSLIFSSLLLIFLVSSYNGGICAESKPSEDPTSGLRSEEVKAGFHKAKEVGYSIVFYFFVVFLWFIDHYVYHMLQLKIRDIRNRKRFKRSYQKFDESDQNASELSEAQIEHSVLKALLGKQEGIAELSNLIQDIHLSDKLSKDLLSLAMKYPPNSRHFVQLMHIICTSISQGETNKPQVSKITNRKEKTK